MTRQFDKLKLRLRSLFRSTRVEHDLSRELRAHLQEEIDANIARGLSPAEARAEADAGIRLRGVGRRAVPRYQARPPNRKLRPRRPLRGPHARAPAGSVRRGRHVHCPRRRRQPDHLLARQHDAALGAECGGSRGARDDPHQQWQSRVVPRLAAPRSERRDRRRRRLSVRAERELARRPGLDLADSASRHRQLLRRGPSADRFRPRLHGRRSARRARSPSRRRQRRLLAPSPQQRSAGDRTGAVDQRRAVHRDRRPRAEDPIDRRIRPSPRRVSPAQPAARAVARSTEERGRATCRPAASRSELRGGTRGDRRGGGLYSWRRRIRRIQDHPGVRPPRGRGAGSRVQGTGRVLRRLDDRRRVWCSRSPARTSPACCSRAGWRGAGRLRCGWRLGPAAAG